MPKLTRQQRHILFDLLSDDECELYIRYRMYEDGYQMVKAVCPREDLPKLRLQYQRGIENLGYKKFRDLERQIRKRPKPQPATD